MVALLEAVEGRGGPGRGWTEDEGVFREESVQRETGAAELISICDNADMGRKTDTRACTDRPLSAHTHRHAGRQTRVYTHKRTHTHTHFLMKTQQQHVVTAQPERRGDYHCKP